MTNCWGVLMPDSCFPQNQCQRLSQPNEFLSREYQIPIKSFTSFIVNILQCPPWDKGAKNSFYLTEVFFMHQTQTNSQSIITQLLLVQYQSVLICWSVIQYLSIMQEKWSAACITRFRELCTSESLKMKAVRAEGTVEVRYERH